MRLDFLSFEKQAVKLRTIVQLVWRQKSTIQIGCQDEFKSSACGDGGLQSSLV